MEDTKKNEMWGKVMAPLAGFLAIVLVAFLIILKLLESGVIGILAGCNSTDVPAASEKESNTADTSVDVDIGKTTAAEISTEKAFPGELEKISDPKAAIYNRMLNTIDYFNSLSAKMETSMLNNEIATVEYNTNINSGEITELNTRISQI